MSSDNLTTEQAIVLSRLHLSRGDAQLVGEERAQRLFDAHRALGWRRDEWLADGFLMPR